MLPRKSLIRTGQITDITLDPNLGRITRVTEPGGRYLQFTYNASYLLTRVDAYDGQGHSFDYVVYNYTPKPPGNGHPSVQCLTSVDYSDGSHAYYTYQGDNAPEHPNPPCPCSITAYPLLSGCDDARYNGAMRRIAYEYQSQGPHGAIIRERYWDGMPGNELNGVPVSRIDPPVPSPIATDPVFDTTYTEYRGDGPSRTFTYTSLLLHRAVDGESCPIFVGPAPQQFLTDYTDFQGNSTHLGYDANRYVNLVRDANSHTTNYVRGSPPPAGIGEVLTITHCGGSHIDYTYYDHGRYVHTVSNERQKVTTYTRDSTTHLVTQIDYPSDINTPASFEEFTYNSFGQVLHHHMKNGAYESFVYDSRGLLTDKYNPKQNWYPGGNDPHTHYTYYTAGAWTDRVQTMTLPANVSGNVASETYEYERAYDGSGVTNLNGAAVAGRGLVTKVTHANLKYQRSKYDWYGNKVWQDDELRNVTSFTYDHYNRLTSTTDPLLKADSISYLKPGATSQYRHTTSSIYSYTSRAGIVTANGYDENWRKTSTTAASGTLNLTTRFAYDEVENLTDVTDPRNKIAHSVYDCRNRKTQTTEAYNTPLAVTTVWRYDQASNINQIDRPDNVHETMGYDALNRMIWHSVPRQVVGPSPAPTPITLKTTIYYNPSGTIDRVKDARGKETAFQYNASDERTMMTYPGTSPAPSRSWVYDNAHNLASRTTVHGGNEVQTFDYDSLNRKTDMHWDNSADWAHYTYYDNSRLNTASNPNSTVTRQYDAAGRLTWEQQNVTGINSTKTVNYSSYDNDGRLLRMYVSGAGYDYTYSYDSAGRFWKIFVTGQSNALFEYAYDAASNETDRYAYLPNNVNIQQHYTRDSLNRMSNRLLKKQLNGSWTTFSTEAYTYDHMNRITDINRGGAADSFVFYWDGELQSASYGGGPHFPFTEGQEPDLDTTDNTDPNAGYQPPDTEDPEPLPPPDDYDDPKVGGLLPMDLPGVRSLGYYFDKAGNRQQVTDTANPTTNYVVNNLNQYSSVSGSTIGNGNEHEVSSFQGFYDTHPVNYVYLNDEHLASVSDTVFGQTYNLYYDAVGRCVKRALNGVTTYYICDGEKAVVEYSTSTSIVGRNVYGKGVDEILVRTDPGKNSGQPIYYGEDHEGSVTHLINGCTTPSNQTGLVLEKYAYDAFGVPTFMDGTGNNLNPNATAYNNRFLFTGREYAATYRNTYVSTFSFYEYRARAYSPTLGRFMSEDPKLFDAGDYNLFRYCHNDPVDLTDPMGLDDGSQARTKERQDAWSNSKDGDNAYNFIMGLMQRQFNSAISAGMAGYGFSQFYNAVNDFIKSARPDAGGADIRQIGRGLVKDARDAASEHAKSIRLDQYGRRRISQERAYAEFVKKGGSLQRQGPFIGSRDEQGQPYTVLTFARPPISISHSHGPESGAGLDRADVPSANGHNPMGVPYISSVGWTGDRGGTVHIYVPSGGNSGQFFHSDGAVFLPGP